MTLVATVLVAETSRGDVVAPARLVSRAAAPRWVERLEAALRRSVDSQVLLIAPALRDRAVEPVALRLPPPGPAPRRVLLSPNQFRLPPPAC